MKKPELSIWQIWNMSFGFFGIQIGFALQGANVSRIFQSLGASIDALPILWIAGPVTGLLVQPLVGHFSDRNWTRFGRRRPYFFAGAVLASLALLVMPNSPTLWVAAGMLWILDASINIAMEPFRAFVGDMLPSRQRTMGFTMQSVFIGSGALLASMAPFILANVFGVANTAEGGGVPAAVKLSFYIGSAALFLAILWTVRSTREYSPTEMEAFDVEETAYRPHREEVLAASPDGAFYLKYGSLITVFGLGLFWAIYHWGGDKQFYVLSGAIAFLGLSFLLNSWLKNIHRDQNFLSHILADLMTMPLIMRRLAIVQFFSWFGLFIMWIYSTPAVTAHAFGSSDPASALYNKGADWVGVMFAVYNGVAAVYALFLPKLAKLAGRRLLHAINLLAGALGFFSYFIFTDPWLLLLSMVGVGMAWASILSLPYSILADAVPPKKLGIYMGIFNFFIVLPQLIVAGIMGPFARTFLGGDALLIMVCGGISLALSALSVLLVRIPKAG